MFSDNLLTVIYSDKEAEEKADFATEIIMSAAIKKRKVDRERRCFQERWKLQYFFTESNNNCVCLVCHETISVYKDYNVKRHYETKHASTFDKLSEADCVEKVKQVEHSLATLQQYFKRAQESNESITKASLEVALLIAKHCRLFAEGKFIKKCVIEIAEHICPQDFVNVCLARNTVTGRIEELSTDI